MGGIRDEHVEWAIVNRLKAILEEPSTTTFNVTESFALFSSILLWSKNRLWFAGNKGERAKWDDPADQRAHDFRVELRQTLIIDEPWCLSCKPPEVMLVDHAGEQAVNADFAEKTAEEFFQWLRDALAHGDGRRIRPIHKLSRRHDTTLLAGFEIKFPEAIRSKKELVLSLYSADIRRMGIALADRFCRALSGGELYFEEGAGTARIREQAA